MLHRSSDKIRHCYQRAAECRERALSTHVPKLKADMFAAEDRWIRLAQSCALTESLETFSGDVRRYLHGHK
jgi:hypothetical protein